MKKYIILTLSLLLSVATVFAQDEDSGSSASDSEGMGATAGDFTAAVLFGRGNFLSSKSAPEVPKTYIGDGNWNVYGNTADTNNGVDDAWNGITNMIGAEVRYFVTNVIAVKLSGGAIMENTPARQNIQTYHIDAGGNLVPGNDPSTSAATWIPEYHSVSANNRVSTNVNVGGEYHFPSSRFERLYPYLGANFNYYYARTTSYNPTIIYDFGTNNGTVNSGGSTPSPGQGSVISDGTLIYDVGPRSSYLNGFGGQVVAGIDVYITPGVYVGLETKPLVFLYANLNQLPAPGLETWSSETQTWSFFSQTFFKIGFIVGQL